MNQLIAIICAAVAIVTAASFIQADSRHARGARPSSGATLATMTGQCHTLILGGTDASAQCEGKVVNTAYRSGRSSFQFTIRDRAILGFHGVDSPAGNDQAVLRIDGISLNLMMGTPPTTSPASGTCSYTNPYAGPAMIRCSAISAGRRFEASFEADGRAPVLKEF